MAHRSELLIMVLRGTIAFGLILGIVAPLEAQFLVPDQEYRYPPSDHTCKSPRQLSSFEAHTTTKGNAFTINFVEYNDKGRPWNPVELSDALDQQRKARGTDNTQGILVVVYIHGWQNSADDIPGSCQVRTPAWLDTASPPSHWSVPRQGPKKGREYPSLV